MTKEATFHLDSSMPSSRHGNGHEGDHGHVSAEPLLPGDEHQMQHAFVMVGDETVFLIHMTMFDMEAHCYQLVLEVSLPEEVMAEYRNPRSGADANTFFVGTQENESITIPELATGDRDWFRADVFRGIPPRKKNEGWPWKSEDRGTRLVGDNIEVHVKRVVYARHFDFGLDHPKQLTYILFGSSNEAHLTNFQTKEPDFDNVLSLKCAPGWLPEPKLRMGVHVTFPNLPGQPHSGQGTYCSDPLGLGQHKVRYYGQGEANLPIDIARSWWCSAAVVNHTDPCALPDDAATAPSAISSPTPTGAGQGAGAKIALLSEDSNPHRHVWESIFRDGDPKLKKFQKFNAQLPSPPRCKLCYAPYRGLGGWLMKLQKREPSSKNPLYCSLCDQFLRAFPGGAEVDMTVVFVDVRDSTGLAARSKPEAFMSVMKAFYDGVMPILNRHDGFIADVRSDSVLATYPPGFSGLSHAAKAVSAVRELLCSPVRAPNGSPIEFAIGAHTGPVWVGTMTGSSVGFEGISAEGMAAIVASRLCSSSAGGQALVSDETCAAARIETGALEHRHLRLKGLDSAVGAHVFTA